MFHLFKSTKKSIPIYSPVSGICKPLDQVNDPVFSKGTVGNGFAVEPTSNIVKAPIDGEITMIFPTKHAIGLKSKNGVEVLLHIGIDTVQLKGEGFELIASEHSFVAMGDPIVKVDFNLLKQRGYDCDVLCVVTTQGIIKLSKIGEISSSMEAAIYEPDK